MVLHQVESFSNAFSFFTMAIDRKGKLLRSACVWTPTRRCCTCFSLSVTKKGWREWQTRVSLRGHWGRSPSWVGVSWGQELPQLSLWQAWRCCWRRSINNFLRWRQEICLGLPLLTLDDKCLVCWRTAMWLLSISCQSTVLALNSSSVWRVAERELAHLQGDQWIASLLSFRKLCSVKHLWKIWKKI